MIWDVGVVAMRCGWLSRLERHRHRHLGRSRRPAEPAGPRPRSQRVGRSPRPVRDFPVGSFDLVSAHYLQTPYEFDRSATLRAAAHALNPGGLLLVVDHGSIAPWSWNQEDTHFVTPDEVAKGIALDPAGWSVERAEAPTRMATGPNGERAEVVDHVLMIRRAG